MRKMILATALMAMTALAQPFGAMAADAPAKKTAQVKSGLYVTATEAHALMQADEAALLVDVRDPIEIMFTGYTQETDIHVPYRMSDRSAWNPKKSVYAMPVNADFADEMEARLTALGVTDKDTPLIFMCRSGSTRSAPAADLLHDRGWTRTYTVVDGFEGSKSKEGPSAGVRDVNGWRNSGLPWGYALEQDVVYGLR